MIVICYVKIIIIFILQLLHIHYTLLGKNKKFLTKHMFVFINLIGQ